MKKQKITAVLILLLASVTIANAQSLRAQTDWFNTLENTCNNYLNVTENDSAITVLLTVITQPQHGIATVNGNYISYCPASGYNGADFFTYGISDSVQLDTARVYINVLPYNSFIFAGDADQNGRVENFDVLALGLAYGLTGPPRLSISSINSLAWAPSSYINSNPGAADCNGDGIVDYNDLISIETSYRDTFPLPTRFEIETSLCGLDGIPFYIESLNGDTVLDGDTLDITIKLGQDFTQNEAYGIAFTLEFENGFVNADATETITSSSWLFQNDTGLLFKKNFQSNGEVDFAYTKTNHLPANGGGQLLRARLPIDDNIDGIISTPGWHNLNLKLTNVRLVSEYNVLRPVCVQQPSLVVYKAPAGISTLENRMLKLYPNPANSKLFIEAEDITDIEVCDITGRMLQQQKVNFLNRVELDLSELALANGAYFVRIKTNHFVSTQKIFVQH